MWDLNEDEEAVEGRKRQTEEVRGDVRIMELRGGIESALGSLVSVWNGDSEVADVSLVPYFPLLAETKVYIITGQILDIIFRHTYLIISITTPTSSHGRMYESTLRSLDLIGLDTNVTYKFATISSYAEEGEDGR